MKVDAGIAGKTRDDLGVFCVAIQVHGRRAEDDVIPRELGEKAGGLQWIGTALQMAPGIDKVEFARAGCLEDGRRKGPFGDADLRPHSAFRKELRQLLLLDFSLPFCFCSFILDYLYILEF